MKKILFAILAAAMATSSLAQSARDEIKANVRLSASNHLAYPGPSSTALTPAPTGYQPVYISHYGRHGSRFLIWKGDYDYPLDVLRKADAKGKLTLLGHDVLGRIALLRAEADKRFGELTPLGAEQHRQIANRMYHRFPEVFAGEACVDANSTVVIRCILSMENELLELTKLNPRLVIKHDASEHDMYYMNLTDTALNNRKRTKASREAYEAFYNNNVSNKGVMKRLFNDTAYVNQNVNARKLNDRLFHLASTVQNTESRYKVTLYDLFDDNELYANWRANNAQWYLDYGNNKLNGGKQPFSQRNLLRRFIDEADSCLLLSHPGATLRFGHETMVLPLVCLMDINGYGQAFEQLEQLDHKGWVDYRVFPMGANVQLVFYRRNATDDDILVKVLLNENEASLPIKTDIAPYYHWKDVRQYYLDKLNAYSLD